MSKRITPFTSQNTVIITLAADLCTLNFLVTGEDGCFQVMKSRALSLGQTLHSNGCSATVGKFFLIVPTVPDFHLFGTLKRHLGGTAFETEDDLISELRNWFDNLDVDFLRVGINSLLSR
ncbi:histone-lysine N-methyltransferase SETMAR [Plakobranchus ocellatus]|uniref:Histone-lysine N-methyltransferase SETMAR n=1 Tax=Plakobranchus ocellatus TaxID=259542 RepID=A0AAV4AGX8_9GAST|nr:histone-lysine N-methyltransferase SETMAR [Plakobranchus ocellatus]